MNDALAYAGAFGVGVLIVFIIFKVCGLGEPRELPEPVASPPKREKRNYTVKGEPPAAAETRGCGCLALLL